MAMKITATKIWTGKHTLYELVAVHSDGRRVLVQYTNRNGGLTHDTGTHNHYDGPGGPVCGPVAADPGGILPADLPAPDWAVGRNALRGVCR